MPKHRALTLKILLFLLALIKQITTGTVSPIFVTTLSGSFECGTYNLQTSSPTTSGSFSSQSTTIAFANTYFTAPVVAHGIKYIYSNWVKTNTSLQTIFDISVSSSGLTSHTVKANFTVSTVQQLSINYIVCLPNSYFFLDVRSNYIDLSTNSTIFTSSMSSSRSVNLNLVYKNKSNTSNAKVVLSVVGMSIMRQSNTFEYTLNIVSYTTTTFTLTLTLMANNGMRFIRLYVLSYELTASQYTGYVDMGVMTSLGGSVVDSSGLGFTTIGNIFTGITDWILNDANAILTYNLTQSGLSQNFQSSTVTRLKMAYVWYREVSCPNYYYLVNDLCYSCDYTCTTCSDSTNTTCLTCQTSSFRTFDSSTGTCPCNNNYLDLGAHICQQIICPTYCSSCSSNNVCVGCKSDLYRTLSNGSCICAPYTMDMSPALTNCQICFPTCYTCSALLVQTACLTCSLSRDNRQFLASNSTCVCVKGYYQVANLNTAYITYLYTGVPCIKCQYTCSTCSGNSSCLTCNSTLQRVFDSNNIFCVCTAGYFDNAIESCYACSYTCATCSNNSTNCLTCPSTRQLSGNTCPCSNGYYDGGSATCLTCLYSCYTCTNISACLTCNSTYFRSMSNQTCACVSGYYDIGVQTCSKCETTCGSCNGLNNNNCLSCTSLNNRQLTSNNTCACSNGYYEYSPVQATCATCYYKCSTCSYIDINCTSCSAASFRIQSGTTCTCSNGYYDNGGDLICKKCLYYCLTCTSSDNCATCDSNTRNTSNLTSCPCLAGFYDDGVSSSCQPCRANCLTCTNGNNCTTCPSNRTLTSGLLCVCKQRTFQPYCASCLYSCASCSTSSSNCLTCNGTALRYLSTSGNSSSCICYAGYYDDTTNELCAPCNFSCATCTNASACLTCPTNRQFNGSYCSCKSLFYQDNTTLNCLSCHYSCQACSSYSVCTSCDATSYRTLSGSTSLCACMTGYYDNGVVIGCFSCSISCASCSNFSTCTSCDASVHLVLSNNICVCSSGYFLNATASTSSQLCVACHYSCATCTDSISCVTCQSNRTLITGGLCSCISGMFDSSVTYTCQSCSYPCITCVTNSTKCLSCDSNRTYNSTTNQCICKDGTYDTGLSCASCLSTCQTCSNASACLTCLVGSGRSTNSSGSCVCSTGYQDQNGTALNCSKCHYSCVTCINSLSCTSCYGNRIAVNNNYCSCPTNLYYDVAGTPQCQLCHYSCLSCSGVNTNCTSCQSSYYRTISNNSCLCNSGYYDDGSLSLCKSCHYSCQTCSTNSSCLLCNTTNYRQYVNGPYCTCKNGYFDNPNVQLCSSCSYKCLTCVTGSQFCLTCPSTRNFSSSSSSCPCNNGLYDSSVATCASCAYYCSTCSNAITCSTCPTTRLLSNSMTCDCLDGYYNVVNVTMCSSCPQTCKTCSTYQNCTSCDFTTNLRQLVNISCACNTGYFDASTATVNQSIVCQRCPHSCSTCVSLNQCTSCNIANYRVYDLSTSLCSCNNGYYDDGTNQMCIACPFDCLTCANNSTCLSCSSTRQLSNISRCVCIQNYFVNNNTLCQKCPDQCSTCNSSSFCTACVGVRILSNGACICPLGLYSIAGSANCSICHYSCASCVSSSQCSTCTASKYRYLTATYCFCMQSYFDDNTNQLCLACDSTCLTCNRTGFCLSCDNSKNRFFNSTTQQCQCVSRYYQNKTSKLCIQCSFSCLTCVNTSDTCTSCETNYMRVLNNVTKKCDCPTYYYYDTMISTVCASCDYSCYSCSGSSITCTSCLNTTFRNLSGSTCPCMNGYYNIMNQPVCQKCNYQCVTCQGDANNCTLCSAANFRNNTPNCSCINGYYDNNTAVCLACQYSCQTCLNALSCQTCNLDTSRRKQNSSTLFCDCIDQFYDAGIAICQSCHYTCLTCNHPSLCLSCPTTRALSVTSCLCLPKYYDSGSFQCASCHYSCQTCVNSSSCSSCNNATSFRIFNSSTYLCSCRTGYYDTGIQVCSICNASCLTCSNVSACETCPLNINKTINSTVNNFCTCLYGYYENITAGTILGYNSVCSPCDYSCQTCSNRSTYCTLCNASSNRQLNAANRCACLTGYFEIVGQQLCLNCYINCLSCFGTLPNQCITCDNTTYYLNNSCYTTCPSYYTNQTTPSRVCVSCPSNCLSCPVSTTVCSQCASPYFIFSYNSSFSVCVNQCPQLYYKLNQTCLACVWPCITCNSSTSCLSCSAGYYLANNYCYPCQKSCLTCSGSTALDCLTCISNYILKNGVCQKMSCGDTQYVDSTLGCLNCSSNFANSLTCLSTGPLTCQPGYLLTNNSCGTCTTVTGYTYDATTGRCKDKCGDGIIITDLCDDGNTLNGDGCSSICTIETGWRCPNNVCSLIATPSLTLVNIRSFPANHSVVLKVQLNLGLRLIQGNFILKFTTITNFVYTVSNLNPQYTLYQLVITYYQSPQNEQLSISVKSPISRLLAERSLQTTTLQLSITLSLNLDVSIQTYPPAIYVSNQQSQIYSKYVLGVISFLHISIIIAIIVVLLKKLKVMLLVIDALNSLTILYILSGLGLHNITLVSYQSIAGLQPFIYGFGQYLKDQTTNFYYFNYRSNFFSSTAIQMLVIAIILIGLTVKAFSKDATKQNYWHYYRTAFVFAFAYDLLLSCFCTFFWSPYYSYQSSYSWMASLFGLIWILCQGTYYYKTMSEVSLDRKIVPDFTYITGVNQIEKGKNEISNIMIEFEDSKERETKQKEKDKHDSSRDRDDPKTEEGEESILDTSTKYDHLKYFDLVPSVETLNTVLHSNHITSSQLPTLSIFFAILFTLLVNIQSPKIRVGLLFGSTLGYLLALIITKNEKWKAIRTMKLMMLALIYVIIAALGLAAAVSSVNLIMLDIILVVLVCLALLINLICFIVNVLKSEAYREYVKQKQIQIVNQRKKKQSELRQKIYNNRNANLNTSNSKAHIEEPKSSMNIFQPEQQISEEQVEEKELKISELKKFREIGSKVLNRQKNNSTMLNQIDDEVSGIEDGFLNRKDLNDDKKILDIKNSRVLSSRGNRIKAIRDSQLSRNRRESPSYFDNTLQRIEEEKGVRKKVERSNEREEVSPTTSKKKLKKKVIKVAYAQEKRIDDEISMDNDQDQIEKKEQTKKIEDILQEMDMPRGFKQQVKIGNSQPRLFDMDEISSIREERRQQFMEQGIDDEKGGMSVFNKILQDYKVYRNKKVNKKKLKQVIQK